VSLRPTTDGVVEIRPPASGDAATLIAGRDAEFHRFLGPGADEPQPVGCIVVVGDVVGWVDYDVTRDWLVPGEVNVGYYLFASARGRGYATRAVHLLLHHLAVSTDQRIATLLIARDNHRSLALADRAEFVPAGDVDGSRFFKRAVPPLAYTDGVVKIRRLEAEDLDRDLEAKDDVQIRWLWLPGQREQWAAMAPSEQRAHALAGLCSRRDAFGAGPKWEFAADGPGERYVAYVDCDLANDLVPHGEANIAYSCHPAYRGRGYVSRAVRLILDFLRDHTAAPCAHIIVDAENIPSLRVARAVGAVETERWVNDAGRTMLRHLLELDR